MKGDVVSWLDADTVSDSDSTGRPAKQYLTTGEIRRHAWWFAAQMLAAVIGMALALLLLTLAQPVAETNTAAAVNTAAATNPAGAVATPPEAPTAPAQAMARAEAGLGSVWSSRDLLLMLLVMSAGAMGGLIHAATSFATFAGNRQLLRHWMPWFYLRPPIGVLLALIVYLATRGGVFGSFDAATIEDSYLLALFGGLAGLFSKQTADKLSDLVAQLFVPSKQPTRNDSLDHPAKVDGDVTQGSAPAEKTTSQEVIRRVQARLIRLGYLAATKADGELSDDGIVTDETREALKRFFGTEGVTDADRIAAFGDESSPDFWPTMIRELDEALAARASQQ